MHLNFHLIDCNDSCFDVRLDIEETAHEALVSGDASEAGLMAMAELVDWENAVMPALTGAGLRCERALRQRLLCVENGRTLERMAGRSATVAQLFEELTRAAEGPYSGELLAA